MKVVPPLQNGKKQGGVPIHLKFVKSPLLFILIWVYKLSSGMFIPVFESFYHIALISLIK